MRRFFQSLYNIVYECAGVLFLLIVLLWFCLLLARTAHAAGDIAHAVVTLPTTYNDDKTALPISDIAEVHVQWFRKGSTLLVGERVLPPTQLTTDIAGMKCGDYDFRAYVVTTPTAAYPGAGAENPSALVPYLTGVKCSPKAPTLTVS